MVFLLKLVVATASDRRCCKAANDEGAGFGCEAGVRCTDSWGEHPDPGTASQQIRRCLGNRSEPGMARWDSSTKSQGLQLIWGAARD